VLKVALQRIAWNFKSALEVFQVLKNKNKKKIAVQKDVVRQFQVNKIIAENVGVFLILTR